MGVALRVTDNAGRSSIFSLLLDVSGDNKPPVARARPVNGAMGEPLVLDASLSADPDEACNDLITEYRWDLGTDGVDLDKEPWDFFTPAKILTLSWDQVKKFSYVNEAQPTDPFTRLPVYPGTLWVRDSAGVSAQTAVEIRLFGTTPVPVGVVQPATAGCGVEMVFDGSGSYHSHPDRSIKRYIWDFDATVNSDAGDWDGDGIDTAWDDNQAEGAQVRWSQYAVKGTYDARLMVWDHVVKSEARIGSARVKDPLPKLDFVNQKPIANPGGPYLTTINSDNRMPVNLDGSGSTDPNLPCDELVLYWWDTDDDGCFGADDVAGKKNAAGVDCKIGGEACTGGGDCVGPAKTNVTSSAWRVGQSYVVALKVQDRYGVWSDAGETTVSIAEFVPPSVQLVFPNGGEKLAGTRNIELKVAHPKAAQARLKIYLNEVLLTTAPNHIVQNTQVTPTTVTFPLDTTKYTSRKEFYRIKVIAELASDPSIFATVLSAGPFTIDNDKPSLTVTPGNVARSEERRVGKECRSRW